MKEIIEKIKAWFENNKTLGVIGLVVIGLFILPRLLKMVKPKRRRRRAARYVTKARTMNRSRGSYNRVIKSGVNAGKKAWQIKGSPEAKRRMAALRRMKRK